MTADDRAKTPPSPQIRPAHEIGNTPDTAWIRPSVANVSAPAAQRPSPAPAPAPVRPPLPRFEIPEEARQTADELFAELRRLTIEGKIAIDLDTKHLMHMDSPVGIEAESNQWVYALGGVSALIWWQFGTTYGLVAVGVSLLLYLTLAKAYVRRRIERRVREQVLEDVVRWRKLWTFGGVGLRDTGPGGEACTSPNDNWMDFVRQRMRG